MSDKKPKRDHYINNVKFFEEIKEWKKTINEAEACGEKKPPITNYIGECFLKISEQLATKPNFAHYHYREEMICDAIENCVVYAANFDPEKSSNPFSYFTQIIYYAFLRRIEKEKKQSFIKYKCLQMKDMDGKLVDWMRRESDSANYSEFLQKHFSLTETDISKLEPKKKKKIPKRKRK